MNQEQRPVSRFRTILPVAVPVVVFLVVIVGLFWSIFGTSIMHNVDNPETTVKSVKGG